MDKVTLLEGLRTEAEAAKAASEQAHVLASGETRYVNSNGCFHLIKHRQKGDTAEKLCNFTAEITDEITETDGILTSKVFRISGRLADGRPLHVIEVTADQLDAMAWVTEQWGSSAQIIVGTKYKEHVSAAMKQNSEPNHRLVMLHTGWLYVNKEYVYLTGSGAITARGLNESLETRLQDSLKDYHLPPPEIGHGLGDLFKQVVDLFEDMLQDYQGLLCLGAVGRAVLSDFTPSTVSLYFAGVTGTRKSAIAGVLQSFWGTKFDGTNLPANWSSTPNSLEKQAFMAKDALLVVDDFVARGTPTDVARLHRAAEQLLRGQANQAGRQRLNSSAELRQAYHPRGLILATGEDIPNGHSLQARMVLLHIDKDGVQLDLLKQLQEYGRQGTLAQILSNFIQWMCAFASSDEFDSDIMRKLVDQCRDQLDSVGHARTPDNLAQLLVGLKLLLLWATRCGLVEQQYADDVFELALESAKGLAAIQALANNEASDAERYVVILRSVLRTGRAHVAAMNGTCPHHASSLGWRNTQTKNGTNVMQPQGSRIGWVDADHLYLDPQGSLAVIKQMSTELGNHLGSSEKAASKALREAGWLAKTDGDRNTLKVSCEGSRRNALCFDLNQVMELEGDYEPPNDDCGEDLPF